MKKPSRTLKPAPKQSTKATATPQNKIRWRSGPAIKQAFSLPDSLIYYLAKNPSSPELYNKLIQTCKTFFELNPVLVVFRMYDGRKTCSKTVEECDALNQKCCVNIDIAKTSSKLWFTHQLTLCDTDISKFIAFFPQKVFRCDAAQITFINNKLMFNDYKLLASHFKNVCIYRGKFTHKDRKPVMLDQILGAIPEVEKFEYWFDDDDYRDVTTSTFKKISKLKNLGRLQNFELNYVPEIIEVKDLSAFIKNHKTTKISFDFFSNVSDDYKNQLDALIDTVIESQIPGRMIEYDGQDEDKLEVLESLCD